MRELTDAQRRNETTPFAGALGRRTDMTKRETEAWRPPLFSHTSTPVQRVIAGWRRFLDLQAGTIWRDLSALLPTRQGVLLDVGCGAQPYRGLLSPATKYIGIDTDDAKTKFGYEFPDTIYFHGDRWPLDEASVDVVLCTETIEHVPDTARFMSEVSRVLRPGGELILTVPFSARYHFIPHDYWRFTPASLKLILSASHFDDVAVFARGNAVTVACYKAMALVLPLLLPSRRSVLLRCSTRLVGLALSPVLLVLAAVANASVRGRGGDDCLGYTVLARRSVVTSESR